MPSLRPHFTLGVEPAVFSWRLTDDAAAVHAIHTAVLAQAPVGMVRADPFSHFIDHVDRLGVTIACHLDDGKMIGYGVLGLRSPVVNELADLLGIDAQRLCVLDGVAVLPQWRGHGMHQAAIEQRIAHATAVGRMQIVATVSPQNLRALHSLLNSGMLVHGFALMYAGLPRLIVQHALQLARPCFESVVAVRLPDHAAHQAALSEGLIGYACRQDDGENWLLHYGRTSQKLA